MLFPGFDEIQNFIKLAIISKLGSYETRKEPPL